MSSEKQKPGSPCGCLGEAYVAKFEGLISCKGGKKPRLYGKITQMAIRSATSGLAPQSNYYHCKK